jgi:threonyl-tRNA synthetase
LLVFFFVFALTPHLQEGKWPLWLSPRQLMIVPVAKKYNIYAESVQATLVESGFFCDIDLSGKVMIALSFFCLGFK